LGDLGRITEPYPKLVQAKSVFYWSGSLTQATNLSELEYSRSAFVQPSVVQIPNIIEFLGRNPFGANPDYLGEKLRSLGVDFTILAGWERGNQLPSKIYLEKLVAALIFIQSREAV
jgi:hypothetical protein